MLMNNTQKLFAWLIVLASSYLIIFGAYLSLAMALCLTFHYVPKIRAEKKTGLAGQWREA